MLRSLFLLCLFLGSVVAQVPGPERHVRGNVVTSDRDPRVRIRLPQSAQYVGADRWTLYDVADCELHAFVDADAAKNIHRLFWIQFEQYLPTRPELHHTYDSPRHTTLGGWDFFLDTWVRPRDASTRPGSDREHITALITAKGYTLPSGMMDVRLVHLLDSETRKELMIIYGEDLSPTGLSPADLQPTGNAHDRWPQLEKSLISHAQQSITVEPQTQ